MAYQDFTSFPVWKQAYGLTLKIYRFTKSFPDEEKFILVSDMRRAANSVIHNIAEAYGRFGNKDKTRFYKFSRGSAYELISQLMISEGLSYLNKSQSNLLIQAYKEVISQLDKMIKTIENRPQP